MDKCICSVVRNDEIDSAKRRAPRRRLTHRIEVHEERQIYFEKSRKNLTAKTETLIDILGNVIIYPWICPFVSSMYQRLK